METLRRAAVAGLSDADLLERFVASRDEGAFQELIRLHGPMVLGLCRRILKNQADAEDAFQATFIVLARKASSVRPRSMIGHWLYGVARKAALKAKAMTSKRRRKDREAAEVRSLSLPPSAQGELHDALDEELSRLPEKYQRVLVLCELEGRSVKDVANQLRVPQGTVASRLSRGREMLVQRLQRRGLVVSAATLAALSSGSVATANVSAALASATVQAALGLAAGEAASTLMTAAVKAITDGVLKTMLLTKLKLCGVVLLAVLGICAAGLSIMSRRAEAQLGQTKAMVALAAKQPGEVRQIAMPASTEPPGFPLELRLTAKKGSYVLDLGGKTEVDFRKAIAAARQRAEFPAGPAVDLELQLKNTSDREIAVFLEKSIVPSPPWGNYLAFSLAGPGTLLHLQSFAGRDISNTYRWEMITLAPKGAIAWKLDSLGDSSVWNLKSSDRWSAHVHHFWTRPGEYLLSAKIRLAVEPPPAGSEPISPLINRVIDQNGKLGRKLNGGWVTLISDPVKLVVKER